MVTDYDEKKDIIKLRKDQQIDSVEVVKSANKNAQDAIYTFNDGGSIRINEAVTITYRGKKAIYSYKKAKFVSESRYTLQGSGSDLTLIVNDAYVNKIGNNVNASEISPVITILNASSVNKKYGLNLTSNGLIKAGKSDDTLKGGTGSDTLTGGNGKDVFVYGWSNDVITDYTSEDRIVFEDNQELISYEIKPKTKHVILSVGIGTAEFGTIQINNGQGKEITVGKDT